MPATRKAPVTFRITSAVLLCSVIATGLLIVGLVSAERSIRHAYVVQVALGRLDAAIANAGRSRLFFVESGSAKDLQDYESVRADIYKMLDDVHALTAGNPLQEPLYVRLADLTRQRIDLQDHSIQLRQQGPPTPRTEVAEGALTVQAAKLAVEGVDLRQQMSRNEEQILAQRTRLSNNLSMGALVALCAVVCFSILLLGLQNGRLRQELSAREQAELAARSLSARLLRIQDEGYRRIARELHDSLGQNLAAGKLMASNLLRQHPNDDLQAQLVGLLDQCVRETRSLAYLLHPPLLDEMGLTSAVTSFVEGFAQRTGIAMTSDIQGLVPRLPQPVELVLFRALQEALANLHRHSNSASGEVSLRREDGHVELLVRDFGKGMPLGLLEEFRSRGTGAGVGLAGMRERVREQGGTLEISSNPSGTLIRVAIPVGPVEFADLGSSAATAEWESAAGSHVSSS